MKETFKIYDNQIKGTFPYGLYNLESLVTFDCSRNMLSGNISSKFEKLMNLTSFIIFSNMFTGTIPPELASLEQIQMLMVHQDEFSGTISNKFCGLYEYPHSLSMFYADCSPTDIIGPPAIVCDCCTHCRDIVHKNCTSLVPVFDVPDDGLG